MTDTLTRPPAPDPAGPARPGPDCPAISGHGTDPAAAAFRLMPWDVTAGPGRSPVTDVLAYFVSEDEDDEPDDAVIAQFLLPRTDPDAVLARRIAASPGATAVLAAILRYRIAACPCPPGTGTCPALSRPAVLTALHALDPARPGPDRRRRRRGGGGRDRPGPAAPGSAPPGQDPAPPPAPPPAGP